MTHLEQYESQLNSQIETRRATVELIKEVNDIWYDKSIELVLFRERMLDKNPSEVLNIIEYGTDFVDKTISVFDALSLTKGIKNMNLVASKIDLGKLVYKYNQANTDDIEGFLASELKIQTESELSPKDVVLYGFGRIGRLLARELMSQMGPGRQLRLRAIVVRGAITEQVLQKRASLLAIDSVHGDFNGVVKVDVANESLVVNGMPIRMISANQPENIDYTQYGINNALIIDNTGVFRDDEAMNRHLQAKGAAKVLLTAPGKGVPNIVYGVNHNEHSPQSVSLFSAASCTTNAITPVLKVINDHFGIDHGHLETIHAYTNDQNLVDNHHKKERRGRAAALNMVITETGAGKAVSKALPELEGKLTSNAIRVPVPNGSLVVLKLDVNKATNVDQVNNVMKQAALEGDLVEQIHYSVSPELVSSDIVGTNSPSIFDSQATIVKDKQLVLYVWYDNEYGYSHQVMRLARHIAEVQRPVYF